MGYRLERYTLSCKFAPMAAALTAPIVILASLDRRVHPARRLRAREHLLRDRRQGLAFSRGIHRLLHRKADFSFHFGRSVDGIGHRH